MGFYEKASVTYVREACSRENTQCITLSVWILITLLLSFTLPQVNSTKEPNPKNLPETAMSQQAEALMKKEFPNNAGNPLLVVWYRDGGLQSQDYKLIQDVYKELKASPLKEQSTLPPFDTIPNKYYQKCIKRWYIICYTVFLTSQLEQIY